MGISDDLADAYTGRGINLLRFDAGERKKILAILRQLEEDLVRKLRDIDPTEPTRARYKRERLKKLLAEVRATISTAYRDAATVLNRDLRELARVESAWAASSVKDTATGES